MIYPLILLQPADIATTHYALKSGAGTEGNPVLRKLFGRFGHERVLLLIKGAFIALVTVAGGAAMLGWLMCAAPAIDKIT